MYLDLLKGLDDIHFLQVVVGLQAEAAVKSAGDFLDIVLEALERGQLTRVDNNTVADDAHLAATLDLALDDHGAGDGTHLADVVNLTHL